MSWGYRVRLAAAKTLLSAFFLLLATACSHRVSHSIDLRHPQTTDVVVNQAQATIEPGVYDQFVYDSDSFSCQNFGQVLVARIRRGGTAKRTEFWCGKVMLNGEQVRSEDQKNSGYFVDRYGWYYSGPNRVMTYGDYDDHDGDEAKHGSSILVNSKREILNVRPDGIWRHAGGIYDKKSECPPNMAMVARAHATDYLCATIWAGNPAPTTPSGVITFRHWDTKQPCSVLVPNGPVKEVQTHMLMAHDSPCANDVNDSIELEGLPSAATILLTDGAICEKDGSYNDFWVELRTTAKSVTVDKINLDEFFGFSPGAIVLPGVKLVAYHRKAGASASKKLSCVQITTSAAPPSP